ncbi:hypothetical protein GCM10023174_26880 [Chelativorans composti]|uniref:Uncharacterized protein n=1 Tax=Chelativorans composti TaxID=768533 RepID=A0ABW5DJQ5_9HYPH
MQLFVILLFMLILPIVSIAQDLLSGTAQPMASIGTWFVYWGVGWRLVAAGVFQLFRPSFTARNIFEIEDPNVIGPHGRVQFDC